MVISRTPFRISFFGGGTDYPAWYRKNGGMVLATTINKYCYISARFLPPFFGYKYRVAWSKIENAKSISQITHPAVSGILKYMRVKEGLEIHYDGDLPARSGIGSSSSFTVGLLNALYALKGQMPSKHKLAQECIHLEQKILKETVGSQDQILASYGGFNLITFHKNGEITLKPITVSGKRIEELQSHLMLFYTGISRISSDVAKSYVNNIKDQKTQLEQMQKLVNEASELINSKKDIRVFGHLLDQSWQIKRTLSSTVSNSKIDQLYNRALACGAIGGKLIGAGGGGFLLLFAPPHKQNKILKEFKKLIHVPFKFESQGSQIIFYDTDDSYSKDKKK